MAFQGNKGPDLVSLALNIMQMKRDREFEERRLAIEEFKAQNDARLAQNKNILEMMKLARETAGTEKKASAELAPTLSIAADDAAPMADRAAAARAYLPGLMQEAQFRAGPGNQVTGDILNQVGNEAAAASAVTRATAQPNLDWEYDSAGNKRRVKVAADGSMTPVPGAVWVPPKAGVTVNNVLGGSGFTPKQLADVSGTEQVRFQERMKPYEALDRAQATMRNVRKMADKNGVLPQQASQIIASDAMAALRPEALNEGDVARLTAVGMWNKALARVGLPPQMTVDQLDTLSKMIDDKAKGASAKRRAIIKDAVFRAEEFKINPRLIIGDYADGLGAGSRKAKSEPPTPVEDMESVPGGSDPRFPRIEQ